jgi:hypothetical protein
MCAVALVLNTVKCCHHTANFCSLVVGSFANFGFPIHSSMDKYGRPLMPSAGPIIPSCSIRSIKRAARL